MIIALWVAVFALLIANVGLLLRLRRTEKRVKDLTKPASWEPRELSGMIERQVGAIGRGVEDVLMLRRQQFEAERTLRHQQMNEQIDRERERRLTEEELRRRWLQRPDDEDEQGAAVA